MEATCICGHVNCPQADCQHCGWNECPACWEAAAWEFAEREAEPEWFLAGLPRLLRYAIVGEERYNRLAAQPVHWVWQDYAVGGTIVVIAGPPGGGKTTLLFLLLLARAAHTPIELCERHIEPAPPGQYIVLIEGEHGEPSTARKLVKSASILGPQATHSLNRVVTIARKSVELRSPEWLEIVELVKRGLVSDIAIDTLARVAPGESNSEEAQAKIFNDVAQALDAAPGEKKPTAWLLAHTRKGDVAALDDVSGSTQRVAQADTVILVKPKRDKSTGQVVASEIKLLKAREEPDNYPDNAHLVVGPTGLSSGAPAAAKQSDLGEQLLGLLTENSLRTVGSIFKETGRNKDNIKAELESLEEQGLVEMVEGGVEYNGKSYDGWRLI